MAYGSSYKSSSGIGTDQSTTPERPAAGGTGTAVSDSPLRGASNPNLPSSTIDNKRKVDNSVLKFPDDLADDFYISFNTFKYSNERPSESRRTFKFYKPIVLPLPANLTDSASASYNQDNLFYAANLARNTLSNMANEKGIAGTASYIASKEGYNDIVSKSMDVIKNIDGSNLALGAAVNTLSAAGGPIAAAAKSIAQLTSNPFPIMTFQGTSFKPAFTFDWVLYPESLSEAKKIKSIIGFFRKEMLPERMEQNTSILKAPSIFEIKIHPYIARVFKRCVLTNMTVGYAPNGPSFIYDVTAEVNSVDNQKYPSSISLSLTFQEIEVWLANDYLDDEEFFFDPRPEFFK